MPEGMAREDENQRPQGMEMELDKETTKSKPNELEGSQQRVIIDNAEPREERRDAIPFFFLMES